MELNKIVCDAGILGAGGAGFPTHVKINCKAEYVLANGAECEPLLRVDQQVMQYYAADVVRGIRAVKEFTGAKHAVICLKAHYEEAVRAGAKPAEGHPVEPAAPNDVDPDGSVPSDDMDSWRRSARLAIEQNRFI